MRTFVFSTLPLHSDVVRLSSAGGFGTQSGNWWCRSRHLHYVVNGSRRNIWTLSGGQSRAHRVAFRVLVGCQSVC